MMKKKYDCLWVLFSAQKRRIMQSHCVETNLVCEVNEIL